MKTVERILQSHPRSGAVPIEDTNLATDALLACVEACTLCADACLAEEKVEHLRRCIRTNQDCADICAATVRVIARHTETVAELVRQQIHACVIACQLCSEECGRHDHPHCKACAQACHRCQEACNRLLGQISSSGVISAEMMETAESPPMTT